MKNTLTKLTLVFFLAVSFPHFGISQDSLAYDFNYEVNRVYKALSISRETLTEANTLLDLNPHYKSGWVRTYLSVEITAINDGTQQRASTKNDTLSQAQKDLMNKAEVGSDIAVKVVYIPENNLQNNEQKEINFKFMVNPEQAAQYIGGEQQLTQYLKDQGIGAISDVHISQHHLAAVKFAVNETGEIVDAHIFESSKAEEVDTLLLEIICNMPNWQPASYANGQKVLQEFVLSIGDHRSCVINLLGIRRYSFTD